MSVVKLTPSTSKEFLDANKDSFIVLVFDAEFSGQQDVVESTIKALTQSELKDKIILATVDVEANNDLSTQFSIISVPMIVCVKDGNVVRKIDNFEPAKLVNTIGEQIVKCKLIALDDSEQDVDPKERFKEYLKKLVNRSNVMVFMKGDPKAPRCGFSKQLVELLGKHDVVYETFDILQDEEVRQGLKDYSDWPTYPQIYVKGEFIGGLDILKQMEESGELESTLKV